VAADKPHGAAVAVWRERGGTREWLLLHRAHHGPDYEGDWAWTSPTGARLPGEQVDDCAARELREETGLELPLTRVGGDEWALYVAEAPPHAEVTLDPEHDRYEWLPYEEAVDRCLPAVAAENFRLCVHSIV
jgi:8-oxo-dGTP pyrophosphatase MutT (NUDIX family)